jgi:ABC-type sulfate transport system permease component
MFLEMNVARLEAALALALMMILIAAVMLVLLKLAGGRTEEATRLTRS